MEKKLNAVLNEMKKMMCADKYERAWKLEKKSNQHLDKVNQIIKEYFETKYEIDETCVCFLFLKKMFDDFDWETTKFFKTFFRYYPDCAGESSTLLKPLKSFLTKTEPTEVRDMKKGDLIFDNGCRIVEIDKARRVKNDNWSAVGFDVQTGLKHTINISLLRRQKIISHEFDDVKDIDSRFLKQFFFEF